ncbi:MAG: protein-disulfide reductase DsbD family protein, partial [Pseudomonadales bacterium]
MAFNVVLASVVFVFALSFLGVWEIPIPGFVGSGKANELAQREGAAGAFSKGVLTTVLATPCSGPLLGAALTWAVIQPPLLTYLVFAVVGLGMASPYLLVGVFPKLIGFLPKPGAWMDTFKQMMGFVLLATVVYLLTIIPPAYVVPTVALMIGLWAACWWIGRTALTANVYKKVSTWIQAGAFAAVVGFVAFGWLYGVMESRFQRAVDRELSQRTSIVTSSTSIPNGETTTADVAKNGKHRGNELPWRPYSRALLEKLIADGKTVLVDFTADWCLTCKTNETVALNTSETRRFVEANGIATLKADKTQPAPEVDELLELLGNKAGSIPYYAVFPAGNPNRPILLDGLFTSPRPLLDALRKAET